MRPILDIARHGTAIYVERAVQAYRRVLRIEDTARAEGAHAPRSLRWYYDDDGMLVIHARVPAESGAMIVKALAADGGESSGEAAARRADAPRFAE